MVGADTIGHFLAFKCCSSNMCQRPFSTSMSNKMNAADAVGVLFLIDLIIMFCSSKAPHCANQLIVVLLMILPTLRWKSVVDCGAYKLMSSVVVRSSRLVVGSGLLHG